MLLGILLTILTTLTDGMFNTAYEIDVDTNSQACNAVVDNMIYYLQTNPELLSDNFFAGLGMQSDSKKKRILSTLERS